MAVMDTVLCNEPEVKRLALAALEECTDLQAFGRRCLEILLNSLVSAKADEACGAPYGERSPGRTNSRNGYRERGLLTSAGDIRVRIPKLRTGTFFPEDLIERYCRADRALVAAVAEMYVLGISTRKVEEVAGALGVSSMSKSQVSRLCESLDSEVAAFRRQRFDGVRFAYLWLDATYVKCRVDGRSVSQAVVTAIGLDDTGHKRFLGVDCVDTESYDGWRGFLSDLRSRGVAAGEDGVQLVVSDAHEGLPGHRGVVPGGRLAALHHAPDAQRRRAHPREGRPEGRARGDEGGVRPEEPARGAGVLPEGRRGGREAVAGGGQGHDGGRGGGPRLPGLPRVAPLQDPHEQRPGAGQPRDQAADQRRAGIPLARVPHPPGGRGAHRGRRGVVRALRHLQALARPRVEEARGAGAERGVRARGEAGRRQDNLGGG